MGKTDLKKSDGSSKISLRDAKKSLESFRCGTEVFTRTDIRQTFFLSLSADLHCRGKTTRGRRRRRHQAVNHRTQARRAMSRQHQEDRHFQEVRVLKRKRRRAPLRTLERERIRPRDTLSN